MQSSAAPTSKSDFIAAARRAAQAAGQEQARASRSDARKPVDRDDQTARTRVAKRTKSALLAASIVAIIVGSFQLAGNVFDFSIFDAIENKLAANLDSNAVGSDPEETDLTTVAAIPNEGPATAEVKDLPPPAEPPTADAIANLLSPQVSPLAPGPGTTIPLGSNFDQSLLTPPRTGDSAPGTSIPGIDITGTVAHAPAASPKRQSAPPQQVTTADRLPANIGSSKLRNAAIGGDAGAAYEVAMRFVEGRGVPANLEEAARWFERAASKGLTPAQFRYASMLEKGQGVKKDLPAAQRLYITAASKGHAKAMHNLAVLYAEGIDGKPDYTSAAQWFRKAAEHGVADSQYNLGILTARGLGTDRNLAESYKWFALAASQGDKEAVRKRDEVSSHLDAQTLASAQQAVKGFEPAKQPAEAITVAAPPGGWDRTT
jgi:localization factor PodJL